MFLILALPRSRTAWLSHYLSYPMARPPQLVGHDILGECESVQMFLDSYKNGMWGTVETAGSFLWRIVRQELPDCKIVLIRRPLVEVTRSLINAGLAGDLTRLAANDALLDAAATDPEIVSVPFNLLSEPWIGRWLFESLLELEWDFEWWYRVVNTNIQINVPQFIEKIPRLQANLDKVGKDARKWQVSTRRLN